MSTDVAKSTMRFCTSALKVHGCEMVLSAEQDTSALQPRPWRGRGQDQGAAGSRAFCRFNLVRLEVESDRTPFLGRLKTHGQFTIPATVRRRDGRDAEQFR
jgi:hypothetical protein